jgi:hypothetical protein
MSSTNDRDLPTLSTAELVTTSGGMKWEGLRQSYNVEDRRPGAPPLWRQKVNTLIANWKNGYWY